MKRNIYRNACVNGATADESSNVTDYQHSTHYEQEMIQPHYGNQGPYIPPNPSSPPLYEQPDEGLPSNMNQRRQNQANAGNPQFTASPFSFEGKLVLAAWQIQNC